MTKIKKLLKNQALYISCALNTAKACIDIEFNQCFEGHFSGNIEKPTCSVFFLICHFLKGEAQLFIIGRSASSSQHSFNN